MEYNISAPSLYLSQYVKNYWGIENCVENNTEYQHRIIPSGLFEIIFYFGDVPVSNDLNKPLTDNIILNGHQKKYYDITISGSLDLFAIYFYPHGLSMFLNLPVSELFNQSIPLRDLVNENLNEFEDQLAGAKSFNDRTIIANEFLFEKLKRSENKYHYERIRNAINQINISHGIIDIEKLASDCCLSRKQFERVFSEIVGASPKKFLKIVRFQNAIHRMSLTDHLNFTELAYQCGYFDQAHMNNDFKSLSGLTPKQYFIVCTPYSDYFS